MSFEKPSNTPKPEQETQKPFTSEEVKNQEKIAEQAKVNEKIASVLNSANQKFFERMPEQAKNIATQIYEGVYKTPIANRIVGKLEIAYNQFWIDEHQKKVAKLKDKMDGFDLQISTLDQSEKEFQSVIGDLKQQNFPGVASLQIKLQDIEKRKAELLDKKDRVQSKFEERDNKLKLYINERDRVADKLIGYYEEKLKPLEVELEKLQTKKDQFNLLSVVAEVKIKEQLAKLDDLRKKKAKIEDALRHIGMSERKIGKDETIKELEKLEKLLAEKQKKLQNEKQELARNKAEINKKIAKVDAKANLYRDKRTEFVRIKELRPIKIEVSPRKKEEFKSEEKIETHQRIEETSNKFETKKETPDKKLLELSIFLNKWNAFIKETYKNSGIVIDTKDFLQSTKLLKNFKLDFEDFKKIFSEYLKFKKLPMEQFKESIDVFFEKKIKS